jgi:hypothetical protein
MQKYLNISTGKLVVEGQDDKEIEFEDKLDAP